MQAGVASNVPENVRNILIPFWGQQVLTRTVDGYLEFFERMTHNAPTGDDNITLAKREIIQAIRFSKIKSESLVWLGTLELTNGTTHIWLLPLPEQAIIAGRHHIQLTVGSEPTTQFCTEALEAELIYLEEVIGRCSPDNARAFMLLERHVEAAALPRPYESIED